jgi:hypothetical protein
VLWFGTGASGQKALAFFLPNTLANKKHLLFFSQTLWRTKSTCFFLPKHFGEQKALAFFFQTLWRTKSVRFFSPSHPEIAAH